MEDKERIKSKYKWMTDDQYECFQLLISLYGGAHHFDGAVKEFGSGIQINTHQSYSTFDFNMLTALVVLAHDRCIRAEITSSGPGLIRVCLWKRHKREGSIYEKHPEIEDHIKDIRKEYR